MTILPGTVIGPYRVASLLGDGGMGEVYYGEHVVLGRPVAIKVLHAHIARDPVLVQRFVNEARIASTMNHRNVVDVLDCGMFPAPDAPGAQWFIAMEFLHGKSLAKFIAEHGGQPIEVRTIIHVLGEAANGLHAAHERHQLVHRDIKPDNLYLIVTDEDPLRVKVLDFGIAKLRQHGGGVQTQSQMGMGTPAYAAPEQLRESKDVDLRADVWALGVVAHEMITGVRPWGSTTSVWEIIAHHTALKKAPDPRAVRPDTPAKLAGVISKAMEPNPERRWKSAKAFVCALAEAAELPWGTGMAILERYAPELTRASNHSLTVGRPMPPELIASPPQLVTARERPVGASPLPMTMSDGVPRLPDGAPRPAAPGTLPLPEAARHISTIASSSGQSIAAPTSRTPRRTFLLAVGGVGLAAAGVAIAIAMSGGSTSTADDPTAAAPRTTVMVDAGATRVEAPPAVSALAIITSPDGAEIFVDGASKGTAPLNLQLPVGATVELRAEAPGRSPATRSVTVEASPATVRLDLPMLVDAGPAESAPAVQAPTETPSKSGGSHDRKRRRRGSGAGTGSGSDEGFNPNDVL